MSRLIVAEYVSLDGVAQAPWNPDEDGEGDLRDLAAYWPNGAEVVLEPTEQPYGARNCAFRDPAGNLIRKQELR